MLLNDQTVVSQPFLCYLLSLQRHIILYTPKNQFIQNHLTRSSCQFLGHSWIHLPYNFPYKNILALNTTPKQWKWSLRFVSPHWFQCALRAIPLTCKFQGILRNHTLQQRNNWIQILIFHWRLCPQILSIWHVLSQQSSILNLCPLHTLVMPGMGKLFTTRATVTNFKFSRAAL